MKAQASCDNLANLAADLSDRLSNLAGVRIMQPRQQSAPPPVVPPPPDDDEPKALSRMATRCLRYGSLAFLVAQDTALVLLMRYSRSHATGEMYLASTAVCCMEVLKLCVCVGMLYAGEARGSLSGLLGVFRREFVEKPSEVLRLAVPSFLYLLQNNLLYFALSNLRATPYKVTYNLKILTSA